MKENLYHITRCVRCGEMPLYLIYYQDRRGRQSHCVMLCTLKKLRVLLRQKKGFSNPGQYGNIIYNGHTEQPNDTLSAMLKSRYDFDIEDPDRYAMDVY